MSPQGDGSSSGGLHRVTKRFERPLAVVRRLVTTAVFATVLALSGALAGLALVTARTGPVPVDLGVRDVPGLSGAPSWAKVDIVLMTQDVWWVASVSLLLVILCAHGAYRTLSYLGVLVPGVALTDAILMGVYVPDLGPTAAESWLRAGVVVGLVVLGIKLAMLQRFSRGPRPLPISRQTHPPLPSRVEDVQRIVDMVDDEERPGRVIPIRGRWGEGKSTLLQHLHAEWNGATKRTIGGKRVAYVIIDVWQLESEGDLQIKVIDALLHEPAYLRWFRWLRIPIGFAAAGASSQLQQAIQAIKLKVEAGKGKSIEAELRMPQLSWQRTFDRITRACDADRTVIALDEIDRATPSAAQAALTFARRSADRAKVIVILPYLRELIRYKAFNPLLPNNVPDLSSSMDAVIYGFAFRERALGIPEVSVQNSDGEQVTRPETLPEQMQREYRTLSPTQRHAMQLRFEEKYLGPTGIRMKPPATPDLVQLVMEPRRRPPPPDTLVDTEQAWVDQFTEALEAGIGLVMPAPPPRLLEARLETLCHEVEAARKAAGATGAALSPGAMAVLALVAADTKIED